MGNHPSSAASPSIPSSFSAPIDPSPCPPNSAHYFLSEGCIFGAKSKLTRMGVYLVYIPIRGNELGAEDMPLSQQIQ